jgi:hypothetical protein
MKTVNATITILIGQYDVDTDEVFTATAPTVAEARLRIERQVRAKYPGASRITMKKVREQK